MTRSFGPARYRRFVSPRPMSRSTSAFAVAASADILPPKPSFSGGGDGVCPRSDSGKAHSCAGRDGGRPDARLRKNQCPTTRPNGVSTPSTGAADWRSQAGDPRIWSKRQACRTGPSSISPHRPSRPRPVASAATALAAERHGFQLGVYDETGEVPFDTLADVAEFVRRIYVRTGRSEERTEAAIRRRFFTALEPEPLIPAEGLLRLRKAEVSWLRRVTSEFQLAVADTLPRVVQARDMGRVRTDRLKGRRRRRPRWFCSELN